MKEIDDVYISKMLHYW